LTREDRAFQIRWEEYKMIQDKIDKIGAFRFRLRGWLITLMTAVATAAFSTNKLTYAVFIVGLLAISGFYMMGSPAGAMGASAWQSCVKAGISAMCFVRGARDRQYISSGSDYRQPEKTDSVNWCF